MQIYRVTASMLDFQHQLEQAVTHTNRLTITWSMLTDTHSFPLPVPGNYLLSWQGVVAEQVWPLVDDIAQPVAIGKLPIITILANFSYRAVPILVPAVVCPRDESAQPVSVEARAKLTAYTGTGSLRVDGGLQMYLVRLPGTRLWYWVSANQTVENTALYDTLIDFPDLSDPNELMFFDCERSSS